MGQSHQKQDCWQVWISRVCSFVPYSVDCYSSLPSSGCEVVLRLSSRCSLSMCPAAQWNDVEVQHCKWGREGGGEELEGPLPMTLWYCKCKIVPRVYQLYLRWLKWCGESMTIKNCLLCCVIMYCLTDGWHTFSVMAIIEWVHMAWNGCIIIIREPERSRVTSKFKNKEYTQVQIKQLQQWMEVSRSLWMTRVLF